MKEKGEKERQKYRKRKRQRKKAIDRKDKQRWRQVKVENGIEKGKDIDKQREKVNCIEKDKYRKEDKREKKDTERGKQRNEAIE